MFRFSLLLLFQPQRYRQCGDFGRSDWNGVCSFLQERATSAQREHGAARWEKPDHGADVIRSFMTAWQHPNNENMVMYQNKQKKRQVWKFTVSIFSVLLVFFRGVSGPRMNGQSRLERHLAGYESSSTVMSSELETTSFCDSDDDDTMSRWEADERKK